MKVAVIWGHHKNDAPWTTHHSFWEQSLREYPGVEVFRYTWSDWTTMPLGMDLYFFVDFHPCLFKVHDTKFHPRVFFWFDSFHHSFTYPAQIVEHFDRSYFCEAHVVGALQTLGVQKLRWLPAAYYPGVYHPLGVKEKSYSFAFVGQPDDVVIRKGYTRKEFLTKLCQEPGVNWYVNQGVYGEAINQVYNESAVLLDKTIHCNLGTRFFETVGSGGFLLVNRGNIPSGMDEVAMDGQHFVSYDDSYKDCLEKMKYYLEHPSERERIAANGEKYFRERHTYLNRIQTIFSDLGYL